jgi:hypothetical protein
MLEASKKVQKLTTATGEAGFSHFQFASDSLAHTLSTVNEDLPQLPQTPERPPAPKACNCRVTRIGVRIGLVVLIAVVITTALVCYFKKRPLMPYGGLFFPARLELQMEGFRQGDPKWRDDQLGWSDGTLGAEGCAVASTAMVLNSYGVKTDPQQLNWYLGANAGYTDQGWLYWERAADLAPDRVRHVYEDLPSYFLIDWNLLRGNPVIVRLRLSGGMTHFVVIAGKQGFDYLIRDPGAGASRGCYPLRELGSKIEALRYYQKLK